MTLEEAKILKELLSKYNYGSVLSSWNDNNVFSLEIFSGYEAKLNTVSEAMNFLIDKGKISKEDAVLLRLSI